MPSWIICRRRSIFRRSKGLTPDRSAPEIRKADDKEPFPALVFKIMTDPFVGQLAFFRVYSGSLNSGAYVFNSTKQTTRAHRPSAEDARQQA